MDNCSYFRVHHTLIEPVGYKFLGGVLDCAQESSLGRGRRVCYEDEVRLMGCAHSKEEKPYVGVALKGHPDVNWVVLPVQESTRLWTRS